MLLVAGRTAGDTAAVLMIGSASLVGLSTGNLYALLASVAPEGAVGMWTGFLNFAGNISGVAAPIVTGILIARTGSYYPGFVVAVVILSDGPAGLLVDGGGKEGFSVAPMPFSQGVSEDNWQANRLLHQTSEVIEPECRMCREYACECPVICTPEELMGE